LLVFFLVLLVVPVWSPPVIADSPPPALEVFVSVPPQAYFVEQIGGKLVSVNIFLQPGQSPHTYEPTPKQMLTLGRSALYFTVGIPFEQRLLKKIQDSHQALTVVDTAAGIKRRKIGSLDPHHGEEDSGHKRDGAEDPHIWLSPEMIKIQVRRIAGALQSVDPENAESFRKNLVSFLAELETVDRKIKQLLAPYRGESFYVFHPAFGYFGDAYGLEQKAVEVEGKRPSIRNLRTIIKNARAENVKIIFVQPQFDDRSAQAIARTVGGVVVPMDPLARAVLKNLEDMAVELERDLKDRNGEVSDEQP
jgi:zinc transport system substrate-binding protein